MNIVLKLATRRQFTDVPRTSTCDVLCRPTSYVGLRRRCTPQICDNSKLKQKSTDYLVRR